jgi:hypothetical protein
MKETAPQTYDAVTRALAEGSSLSEIEHAVRAVVGARILSDGSG